jgi:hypothetical protein
MSLGILKQVIVKTLKSYQITCLIFKDYFVSLNHIKVSCSTIDAPLAKQRDRQRRSYFLWN